MKELLTHRRALKKKKPIFIRQDAHKKVRVSNKWRKPRGSDSKMRVSRRGYHRNVRIGWGSPAIIRGASRDGLRPVFVSCRKDVEAVDPKTECIIIKASVGTKKRLDLLTFAKEKGVVVENIKDADAFMSAQKKRLDSRKKSSVDKKQKRSAKKEKAKKAVEKAKKSEEKKSKDKESADKKSDVKSPDVKSPEGKTSDIKKPIDAKSEEKKEQDKILIKKK